MQNPTDTIDIKITKAAVSRISELDESNIPFGRIFSDHMFIADYKNGEWTDFRIEPYQNLPLSPAISAIHYGQSIFEGMKAYRTSDGKISIFRALDNLERLNKSADRMCMPQMPEQIFTEALSALIKIDQQWIPTAKGTSLYIRPFMFATDTYIGIRPSDTYKFVIFCCPVGAYYSEPVRVKIEEYYVRSVHGGIGFAKAAGNYGSALYPAKMAQNKGYHQLVWTSAINHEYIEESGTMNVCFVINDTLITPPTSETILAGITRRSIVQIAKDKGIKVEERPVKVKEIIDALENGTLQEAFGAGTAATVANIVLIGYKDKDYNLPPIETRKIGPMLGEELLKIKEGSAPDNHGWNFYINL